MELHDGFKQIIEKYTPGVFKPTDKMDFLIKKLYCCVVTRCFGHGVPFTAMVPIGDMINHHDKLGNTYHMVNPSMHLRPDRHDTTQPFNTYFNKIKYMSNFELLFTKVEIECYPSDIQGKMNWNAFIANSYRRTLDTWKREI